MRRLLLLLCTLLLAAAMAPAALAQDPDEPVDDVPTVEPDDGILDPEEIPPESTPFPEPCAPGAPAPEGTDADYYYYCDAAPTAGRPPESPRRESPTAQVQPLAAQQLPLTGSEPLLMALFGAGFLLAGAGLRLTLDDPRRSP
jgi:hypothetical protein